MPSCRGISASGAYLPFRREPIADMTRKAGSTGIIYTGRRIPSWLTGPISIPTPWTGRFLEEAAGRLKEYQDFASFSKRNTQVNHFRCSILESHWVQEGSGGYYRIRANRFLRGMVRGLTGTMLLVGRGQLTVARI